MKSFNILSMLVASTLAALITPFLQPRTLLSLLQLDKCPVNPAQPNGKLPQGSISTPLLVPISAKNPNKAYPGTDWATTTPNDLCTVFNLELDSDATQGKICNLVFVFLGSGKFTFTGYDINAGAVASKTTYNKQSRAGPSPPNPPPTIKPGNSYVINTTPCGIPPGIGNVTVSGSLCSKDATLSFKQSDVICPLGFYVMLTDDPNASISASH
jgi:hypothetical protein